MLNHLFRGLSVLFITVFPNLASEDNLINRIEETATPLHCQSSVIEAMKEAWAYSKNGSLKEEFGFVTYQLNNSVDKVSMIPVTFEYKEMTFNISKIIPRGAIPTAIFHTHPNNEVSSPSQADKKIAETLYVPIYIICRRGLIVYDPFKKLKIKLRDNIEWAKPCTE